MAGNHGQKRITFKRTRPNPLFQSWLQELYDEAIEKDSKLKDMLKEALESISKYPLPLQTGADCAILKGFGKKLCLFLDTKLKVYNSLDNNSSDNLLSQNTSDSESNSSNDNPVRILPDNDENVSRVANTQPVPKSKSPKRPKAYKPAFRSGGYAILITLLHNQTENPNSPFLKKEELIEKAQQYSEESFTRPKPESHYTAWSNMARLITKGLVNKLKSRKPEFSLTIEGMSLANDLLKDHQNTPTVNDLIFNDARENVNLDIIGQAPVDAPVSKEAESLVILPGTFEVILLIDKAETGGVSKKNDPTVAQFKKYPDLKHEYRHLKVGDFVWVARSRSNREQELVLPFIVERKRMDDLGASIKDGRFHEQKFRLRKCGLKNVLYLVEHYGGNKHVGLPLPSLMQALANTRVQDGFKIHITGSLTNTARFLAMMTKRLTIEYKDKTLKGVNRESKGEELMMFNYFNKSSAKGRTLTVTETFIKILLQLKGMSVEKALAITRSYATPKSIIEAYKSCSQREGEMLLANLKQSDLSRKVGPNASKTVFQLFTTKDIL